MSDNQEQEQELLGLIGKSQRAAEGDALEAAMRDSKVPWLKTEEELIAYIHDMIERRHNYGTCVYAMSMAAVAAFQYVSSKLGVTGFQAGCADLDILRRTRGFDWGKILNYGDLLSPQYCNEEHFPTWQTLIKENAEELAKRAKELLDKNKDCDVHEDVKAHWEMLASQTR